MVVNVLLVAFVGVFCVTVLVGHLLLLQAVWPGLSRNWGKTLKTVVKDQRPAQSAAREMHVPNAAA